jgi:hypothetical protein
MATIAYATIAGMNAQEPNAASAVLAARDLRVLWHPCTQMKDHETLPLVPIERGEGAGVHLIANEIAIGFGRTAAEGIELVLVPCPTNSLLDPPANFRAGQGAPTRHSGHYGEEADGRPADGRPAQRRPARKGAAQRVRNLWDRTLATCA